MRSGKGVPCRCGGYRCKEGSRALARPTPAESLINSLVLKSALVLNSKDVGSSIRPLKMRSPREPHVPPLPTPHHTMRQLVAGGRLFVYKPATHIPSLRNSQQSSGPASAAASSCSPLQMAKTNPYTQGCVAHKKQPHPRALP